MELSERSTQRIPAADVAGRMRSYAAASRAGATQVSGAPGSVGQTGSFSP